ncbi:o-succinylbenzoate synthase [Microbacterium sp. A196]|uniref:o-succinylbenzoate synthase n=1 Tax=Microbacterium sp. A196 TaxID=3457320 RepID=UPI003FCF23CB
MTADIADLLSTARVVSLPMTTRFRGVTTREALLFEGPQGWAEFSPFVEYADAEASVWLSAAIDFAWNTQPAPLRESIPVNATVPAVAAGQVAHILARFPGCRTAKVKVADPGQHLEDDIARVRAAREALGPEGRVRIDANAAWNVDEAERALHALAEFDLEYAEQPCATVEELAELRARVKYMGIPIAADESIRKAEDPLAVARAGAADLIVIKAQPLGGIRRALDIVAEAGLPAVVSSALDTAVGLSHGAALAAALPQLEFDCGLGTSALFIEDVVDLSPADGAIQVGRVIPDSARLDRLAASADRQQWWLDRLRRSYALLAASAN